MWFLLFLLAAASFGEWYTVRLTVYSPDDAAVGTVFASGMTTAEANENNTCVLAGDRRYYPIGQKFEVALRDTERNLIVTRTCTVQDRGVSGRYILDMYYPTHDAAMNHVRRFAAYQSVRTVK